MRKIFIFLDDWNSNKNFIQRELNQLVLKYDVTVISNYTSDVVEDKPTNIKFDFYKKKKGVKAIVYCVKFLFDKDFYSELSNINMEGFSLSKLLEAFRFYINAELFYSFLKKKEYVYNGSNAIYYSFWYFWKCYAITKNKSKYENIRIITRTHEYDLYNYSIPSRYQPFKRQMDKNLDRIVFISDHGLEYYTKKYGNSNENKFILSYLGTKDYGAQEYSRNEGNIRIVSCSSIISRKRVDMIVEALGLIDDSINVEWIHFGGGEKEEEIRTLAERRLAGRTNIKWSINGYTKHDKIMDFYKNNDVDVFIMVAESEGNPVSVMEAMSFGIPVIATNINNIPKMIRGNGIILEEPTPECLSKSIDTIFNSKDELIMIMRDKSRKLWEENYNEIINNEWFITNVIDKL